jgi:hypothetical protein
MRLLTSALHNKWKRRRNMKDPNYDSRLYKEERSLSDTDNLKKRCRAGAIAIAAICLALGFGSFAYTQTHTPIPNTVQKEKSMTTHASGTFDVKVTPQTQDDKSAGATVGRLLLDKQFHGDLEATSKGEMLAFSTAVQGSAGYVAMEQVSGTLNGRKGTFALQHSGSMTRGVAQLNVTVVPDSGTGQLEGLAGKMTIKIADGKHSYDFEYTLAKTR